jgi:hypothetical protein
MWQLRPWNSNPLMRGSDRCETVVRMLAATAVMVAVPLAGAAGTASYSTATARINAENASKVAVTATVTQDARQLTIPVNRTVASASVYTAPVRWTWRDRSGTATVEVPAGSGPGDQVRVWLGPDGNPAAAPTPSSAAATEGIGSGLTMLSGIWGGALAASWGTTWLLSSRRAARWEQEWRAIDHRIGGEDRR